MKSRKSVSEPVDLDGFPDFGLEYFFDDNEVPEHVTITNVDSTATLATEWITVNIEHAIPFESIP